MANPWDFATSPTPGPPPTPTAGPDPWAFTTDTTPNVATSVPKPFDLTNFGASETPPTYRADYAPPHLGATGRPTGLQPNAPQQPNYFSTLAETYKDPNMPPFFGGTPEQPSIFGAIGQGAMGAVKGMVPEVPSMSDISLTEVRKRADLEYQRRAQEQAAAGGRMMDTGLPANLRFLSGIEATRIPGLKDIATAERTMLTPTEVATRRTPTREEITQGLQTSGAVGGMGLIGKVADMPNHFTEPTVHPTVQKLSQAMGPGSVAIRGDTPENFNMAARAMAMHGETVTSPIDLPAAAKRIVNKTLMANDQLMQRPEANVPYLAPDDLVNRAFTAEDLPLNLSADEKKFVTQIRNEVLNESLRVASKHGGLMTAAEADTIRRRIEVDYDKLFDYNDKLRNEMSWKLRNSYGRGISAAVGEDYNNLHQEMADAMQLQRVSDDIAGQALTGAKPMGAIKKTATRAGAYMASHWIPGAAAEASIAAATPVKYNIFDIPKLSQEAANYFRGYGTVTDRILQTAQPTTIGQRGPIITPPPTQYPGVGTSPIQVQATRAPQPIRGFLTSGPSRMLPEGTTPKMLPPGPEEPPTPPGSPAEPLREAFPEQPTHINEGMQVQGHDAQGNLVSGQVKKVYSVIGPDGNPQWNARVLDIKKGKIIDLPADQVFNKLTGPPRENPVTTVNPIGGAPTPQGTPKAGNDPRAGISSGPFSPPTALDFKLAEQEMPGNPNNPIPSEIDRKLAMLSAKVRNRNAPDQYPVLNPVTGKDTLLRAKEIPKGTPAVVVDRTKESGVASGKGIYGTRANPEEMALVRDVTARIADTYPLAARTVRRVELLNERHMEEMGEGPRGFLAIYRTNPGGLVQINLPALRNEIQTYGAKAADATLYHEMVHASQHVLGVKGTMTSIEAPAYRRQFNVLGGEDPRGPFEETGVPPSPKEIKHSVTTDWRNQRIIPGGVPENTKVPKRFWKLTDGYER